MKIDKDREDVKKREIAKKFVNELNLVMGQKDAARIAILAFMISGLSREKAIEFYVELTFECLGENYS